MFIALLTEVAMSMSVLYL